MHAEQRADTGPKGSTENNGDIAGKFLVAWQHDDVTIHRPADTHMIIP